MIWISPTIELPPIAQEVLTWNISQDHTHIWSEVGLLDFDMVWISSYGQRLDRVLYWSAFPRSDDYFVFIIPEET